MNIWLMSANAQKYNHQLAFEEQGFIHWRQIRKFEIGDKVFIYCTKPIGKIMYYAEILEIDVKNSSILSESKYYFRREDFIVGKYVKIKLLSINHTDKLTMEDLKKYGFMAPQGPQRVKSTEEVSYFMSVFKENENV